MSAAYETASIPRQVGVYRIDEKIGSGAMGTVYRATHTTLGKQVALKLVQAEDPEGEQCQRFLLEGVAASRVRHPNVVEVLDAGIDGQNAYLAMQLLEGETLAECLERQGRLPVTGAVDLILPVCAALHAAHQAAVLHRDLKPANIFLADVGRGEPEPMLLDFGISKILGPVDAALTQNPKFLGTPLYIAPEQADGASGSAFSDQYSLALSLYETLLGVRPFEKYKTSLVSLLRHVAEGEIRPACDLDASIPVELSDVISRALSTDPRHRFGSVQDFGAALLPFASEARRTLWQHAFVDTERTMASANAPITSNPGPRRISVSVESSNPSHTRESATWHAKEGEGGFISHSRLFGENEEEIPPTSEFNPERSTISRRFSAPTARDLRRHQEPPGDARWEDTTPRSLPETELRASRNSVGVVRPVPASARTRSSNKLVWTLSALLTLVTLISTVVLLRHELNSQSASYLVRISVEPTMASIELDGQQVGAGAFVGTFLRDGKAHHLHFEHPGFEPVSIVFRDSPPPPQVRLTPTSNSEAPAVDVASGQRQIPQEPSDTPSDGDGPKSPAPRVVRAAFQSAINPTPAPSLPPSSTEPPVLSSDISSGSSMPGDAPPESAFETQSAPTISSPEAPRDAPTPPSNGTTKEKAHSIHTGNLDPWAD